MVIPTSYLEPFPHSWSHFVGIYRQKLIPDQVVGRAYRAKGRTLCSLGTRLGTVQVRPPPFTPHPPPPTPFTRSLVSPSTLNPAPPLNPPP